MKSLRFPLSLGVAALLGVARPGCAQGVGVGTAASDASALLEVASATQARGVLLPRLSAAQRAAIISPAPGLLVFQTDASVGLYSYSGQAWLSVATGLIPDDTGSLVPANQGQVNTLPTATLLNQPAGVAVSLLGVVYVADTGNSLIRKITSDGRVSTLAGGGTGVAANGASTVASFDRPQGVAVSSLGVVYVADTGNSLIRRITPGGQVSTLAGGGAGVATNGQGTAASFSGPTGVAVDAAGTVYVADAGNNRIRKITPDGQVSTLAGGGAGQATNGQGAAASFNNPVGVAVDATGTVYVADQNNRLIRKITPGGLVSTLAGGNVNPVNGHGAAAGFGSPAGVAVDAAGTVYVADQNANLIRKITSGGLVSTLAGGGSNLSADGQGAAAGFSRPVGVAVEGGGAVYVADRNNNLVRAIR